MDSVTVSVITPCYNGSRFLRATLESVRSQTRPVLEHIVIDDGSTDDSAMIAESFGSPVRVIRQPNQGESVARNRGLAEARGTHVLFLDADDLLAPEAIERLSQAVDGRSNALVVMGCTKFEQDPDERFDTYTVDRQSFFPGIIESNFAPPHAWLAPVDLIRRAGAFYEALRWFEDWDLWWRVGLQEPTLVSVDYIGALYRQHAKSQLATTRPADRARGHVWLMDRMACALLERPDLLSKYGDQLFWSCWTALTRARAAGVTWGDLNGLATTLRRLVNHQHVRAGQSRLGRLIAIAGPRLAAGFSRLVAG